MIYGNNTTAPAPAPASNGKAPVARAVPFVRAAYKARQGVTPQSVVLGTAVQNMSFVIPAVGGWNRKIKLKVTCVTAANAAATTFAADGPFNALTNIVFKDAAQRQINLFTSGYHAFLMSQFGGYKPFRLDASTRGYSAVTGAGATGGSFSFYIDLPQECGRDGFCSYPNMDASQRLTIDLTINSNANIYGVAPTNPGTLTITPIVYYYTTPAQLAANGQAQETVPPAAGSMQFWRTWQTVLASGENIVTVNLSGRFLRNVIAVYTDATDVRSDTVRPTTIRAELDNNLIFDALVNDWDAETYRTYQLDNPTGVFPILLGTTDPDGIGVGEWGDDYWATSASSQLVLKFSAGAAGKLYLLLNELEIKGEYFR